MVPDPQFPGRKSMVTDSTAFPRILDQAQFEGGVFQLVQLTSRRFLFKFGDLPIAKFESTRALDSSAVGASVLAARYLFLKVSEVWSTAGPLVVVPEALESGALLSGTSLLGLEEGRFGDLLELTVGNGRAEPFPGWVSLAFLRATVDRSKSTLCRFARGKGGTIVPTRDYGIRKLYWLGGILLYYHLRSVWGASGHGDLTHRQGRFGSPLDLAAGVERLSEEGLLRPGLDPALAHQILLARLMVEIQKYDDGADADANGAVPG